MITQLKATTHQTPMERFKSKFEPQAVTQINLETLYNQTYMIAFFTFIFICLLQVVCLATNISANSDIMHIIDSPTLRGRNDLVDKYSTTIAFIAQCIITAVGFFVIALKTITIAFSILYLTNPALWNKVHEIKEHAKQQKDNDWLSHIVSIVTPDIKGYSDFSDQNQAQTAWDDGGLETIGTYVKKHGITFVVLITLASVLWSGKMLKLVGALSEGCVAVVDMALSIDYAGKVKGILEADRDYKFMFDANTEKGQLQERLAKSLYNQVKTAVSDNRTSSFLNSLGEGVEKVVNEMSSKDDLVGGTNTKHVNWNNPSLTYQIEWNSDAPKDHGKGSESIKLDKGVWRIPFAALYKNNADGSGEVTAKQKALRETAVIYVTFTANQVYDTQNTEKNNNK